MSDFTKHNIQYYETHPALKDFLEKGLIDFAIYDMETERPITLMKKNLRLSPEVLVNPLTVFANYIFDTISHDSFAVRNNKLYELLLTLSTDESNMQDNRPVSMEQINVDYDVQEVKNNYYNDAHLDSILEEYKNALTQTSFLFPIGSFRALKFLKKLANNKLFIISTDKGYNSIKALDNLNHPTISFHGSFSMMVNFHALGQYFKNAGGDYFLQTPRKGIKTSVFCSDVKLTELPQTRLAIEHYVEGVSPADYFTLHRRVSDTFQEYNLETLAAHMNFTGWDPHIYLKISQRISTLASEGDHDTVNFLAQNMPKLAANYYHMPKSECVLFEIAVFFHAIKRFDESVKYYELAQPYVGEQFGIYYNMGLCLYHLNEHNRALESFKKALQIDGNSKEAAEWVAFVEKNLQI